MAGSVAVQDTPGWKCFQKGRVLSRRELYYVLGSQRMQTKVCCLFLLFSVFQNHVNERLFLLQQKNKI